jgi:Peptidase family M23/Fibronectin type III domain
MLPPTGPTRLARPQLSRTTRARAALLCLALGLGLCALVSPASTASTTASATVADTTSTASTASTATTSSSHPYSDPIWYPLRSPALIGCIGNGSGTTNGSACKSDHVGYFGMNLNTTGRAPVYAAGAGRVIAAVSSIPCGVKPASGGNYVKIDHGGGRISMYSHLSSVTVKVGALVAAGTQLGTTGNSGASCSAGTYLDFVVRIDGGGYQPLTKTVTTMLACDGATSVLWPPKLPKSYSAWVKVPYLGLTTVASGSACIPTATPATYATPTGVKASPGNARATVSWAGSQADAIEVQEEIYRPSTHSWDAPCTPNVSHGCTVGYTLLSAGTTSQTVTGLGNGRTYRFRISRHNSIGWSNFSGWVSVSPRTVPDRPGYRNLLGYSNRLELLWSMPTSNLNGSTIRGYQVAISRKVNGKYRPWSYKSIGNVLHYQWKGTAAGARYRVRVRAHSNVGYSAWMSTHYRTTPH